MIVRPFESRDEAAVITLWNRCGLLRPWNDPSGDIRRKLAVGPEYFLVGVVDNHIAASVMAGYDGHRGWFYYLAVDPDYRRRGLARAIVAEAERLLRQAGCPKINLQVRGDNQEVLEFYRKVGYSQEERVSFGKRLDDGAPRG